MRKKILQSLTGKTKVSLNSILRLKENKFFLNITWIISGRLFQMLLQLIVSMVTFRYLGPSNYGIIEYTRSYVAFLSVFAGMGFAKVAVNELLEKPSEQGKTLGTMIVFQIFASLISSVVIIVLVFFIDQGDGLIIKVAFLQSLSLIFQSFDVIDYWYQSRLEAKTCVKIRTIAYIIMASYKILILILQKDVTWFAFTTALENIVVALLLTISYFRKKAQRFVFSFQRGKEILEQSYQFILSGLMILIYNHMDRIMLKQMLNETVVGWYSAAMNISVMWTFILEAFINSAQPVIIAAKKTDEHLYIKQLKRLYAAIIWIGILVAGSICLCSKWIVRILYGIEYLPASSTLMVSVWYTIFSMLGTARNIWVLCENKAKYTKYILGVGAFVNIILNYLLIPVSGAFGAAIATLVTQFVTAIVAPLFFKETRLHTKYVIEAFLLKGIK